MNHAIFITLSTLGPLPPEVVRIVFIQYIFGYFGIGWWAFMSELWIQAPAGLERSNLPETIQWGWVVASLICLMLAAFILLPTLRFA